MLPIMTADIIFCSMPIGSIFLSVFNCHCSIWTNMLKRGGGKDTAMLKTCNLPTKLFVSFYFCAKFFENVFFRASALNTIVFIAIKLM